ncbi:hypothetical protein TPHA_0J01160 [Tetrapisispora phaffii CBS 4417]|uniref:Protein kinase domain-containing protein n=1 Tax=Tetrapisispora phaffii (strain ATCC 24235 / CBS 4417 / NBRC 1672 / NRRL Y-8282 / UCD 70-5) TaxID=1071381 RepID=G8BYJ6_TETPH|nr:hypothetical protein TPHA_0J01160 [Tetrapisispora phaffii CBS 4417]CCE64938.1 hypothetical protein TPHA_0J01160 [Tetrapisispora phaffii CBS 4417]
MYTYTMPLDQHSLCTWSLMPPSRPPPRNPVRPEMEQYSSSCCLNNDIDLIVNKPSVSSLSPLQNNVAILSSNAFYNPSTSIVPPDLDFFTNRQLRLRKVIGKGAISYVYSIASNDTVVLKFPTGRKKYNIIINEFLLLKYLSDPSAPRNNHIIQTLGVTYLTKTNFKNFRNGELVPAIALHRCTMDLQNYYVELNGKLDYAAAPNGNGLKRCKAAWWRILEHALQALAFLKMKKILHTDIKTANVLVDIADNGPIFYISDFTSAVLLDQEQGALEIEHSIFTTLEYCSPELLLKFRAHNSNKSAPVPEDKHDSVGWESYYRRDFYSLGLCLLAFIVNNEPYKKIKDLKFHAAQNITSSFESNQWLLNIILQNTPIKFNIQYDSHLSNNKQFETFWQQELDLLKKILQNKISLEDCITLVKRYDSDMGKAT